MAVARTRPWRFLLTLALHGEVAAVDDQLGAGDIRRLVRGEEQHGVSDLFHPSLSLHRHGPERLRPPLRIGRHLGRPHRRAEKPPALPRENRRAEPFNPPHVPPPYPPFS